MKIVDAFWERKNFENDVVEISVDKSDLPDTSLLGKIEALIDDEKYIVIKIPVAQIALLHKLQDLGFYFMETQLYVSKNLNGYKVPRKFSKLAEDVYVKDLPKDYKAWEEVIQKIDDDMYITDRVYLDPMLGSQMAGNRFRNWSRDLYKNEDSYLATIHLNEGDAAIGYVIYVFDSERSRVDTVLVGLFKEYQGQGLGAMTMHCPIKLAMEKGVSDYHTVISSNNLAVVRLYTAYGFSIDDEKYVLRRWIKKK